MGRRRGFTLIELLVVIAIIAVLMAILMPSLSRVRKQARAVVCQAHLKQWGPVWSMYCEDNQGYFHNRISIWPQVVRPYCREPEIRFCPMAIQLYSQGGRWGYGAWELGDMSGSYGLNQWVLNVPKTSVEGRRAPENMWRTPNVDGGNYIPLFLDCATIGATVWPEDDPPDYDGQYWPYTGNNMDEMRRVCVNRHDGGIGVLFLDYSVRKVGLKELWTLKWHRLYNTGGFWTKAGGAEPEDWPRWMRLFKDY
ncbi:MAG: type II secretion system GspH family protein [Planctomycetes bacterium]|jgi:prepilin-type N-terminal cleavage/methylation domain-containing protein|nr:type II secretion system GspH family protein [Planctomycetota bacterium]